jgi:hypothetical protein
VTVDPTYRIRVVNRKDHACVCDRHQGVALGGCGASKRGGPGCPDLGCPIDNLGEPMHTRHTY